MKKSETYPNSSKQQTIVTGKHKIFLLKPRSILSLILFFVTLSISSYSILNNRQLEFMGGMAEEYFLLGLSLQQNGRFYYDEEVAYLFRPPGYPYFIATVLETWGGISKNAKFESMEQLRQKLRHSYKAIYFAQSLLLGFSTIILFLWLSKRLRLSNAFILALLFGSNPYMIILSGLLHYDMLHIFLTITSCYMLTDFMESHNGHGVKNLLAGGLWGLATLTRPMTLILPLFVFLMFLIKFKFYLRPVLKATTVFTLGMILVIAPYTMRNYILTKRIIPINAQSGPALWAATVAKLDRNPNHYRWWTLTNKGKVKEEQNQINYKIYGLKPPIPFKKHFSLFLAHNVEFNDEYMRKALEHLRHQPEVFLYNFVQNFITFNLDINSVFIKLFQVIQDPDMKIQKGWLKAGNPQNFYSSSAANAFQLFIHMLTLFGFCGICMSIRKDTFLLVPGLAYLCFCIAHSISYMDLMYYYIKIPFLFVFAGYFINEIDSRFKKIPIRNWRIPISSILNGLMIVFGMGLSIVVLCGL